jgi:hypothetical protein
MSLHDAAQHLASQGRYGDNMLVHMNPKEVAGLQALAEQKGVSLTRNPQTGMPEAFGLGDLNPFRIVQGKGEIGESGFGSVLIGAALMAAGVPPMVFGAQSALAGAAGAALLTGGASALMGGGVRGALSSGLGAYGGASMYGAMNPATTSPTPTPQATPTTPVVAAPTEPVVNAVSTNPNPALVNTTAVAPTQAATQVATATPPPGYFDNTMTAAQNAVTPAQAEALKATTTVTPTVTPTTTGPLTNAQVDVGLGKAGTYTPVGETSLMDKTKAFGKEYAWPLAGLGALALTQEEPKGVEVEKQAPGKIRPYIYDPKTGGLTQLRPYDAPGYAGGGDVSMDPNMQQIPAFEPVTRMADGGVSGSGSLNLNIPLNLGDGGGGSGGGYRPMGTGGNSTFNAPSVSGGMFGQAGAGGFGQPMPPQPFGGLDFRAAAANPQEFQRFMQQAPRQEQMYPGSTMLSQMGGLMGGVMRFAGGGISHLGDYSDGGRLLKGPGDGVSDSIPAQIGDKQPARLADGEFVVPARIVSEIGNGSTNAGARKLYAMMDRVQNARKKTTGKNKVAANPRADKYLPA